jgi:hypothetical protein
MRCHQTSASRTNVPAVLRIGPMTARLSGGKRRITLSFCENGTDIALTFRAPRSRQTLLISTGHVARCVSMSEGPHRRRNGYDGKIGEQFIPRVHWHWPSSVATSSAKWACHLNKLLRLCRLALIRGLPHMWKTPNKCGTTSRHGTIRHWKSRSALPRRDSGCSSGGNALHSRLTCLPLL